MSRWRVEIGDSRERLRELADASVDSVVTDPPYELGFMGKAWDASGIAYDVGLWREVLRVLKPGGHLLAFGATRTFHRMVCAVEDAGLEIRDSIHWIYGTGFPKSLDVSKALDKAAKVKRERVPLVGGALNSGTANGWNGSSPHSAAAPLAGTRQVDEPVTDSAREWHGWGTALKPAHEPVLVARKPLDGTVAANVLAHGTGAINVDGCRVGEAGGTKKGTFPNKPSVTAYGNGLNGACEITAINAGRWPPNTVFSHLPECDLKACAEGCSVAELDAQSGTRTSGKPGGSMRQQRGTFSANATDTPLTGYGDTGGASRFFPAFRYQAKAATKERWSYLTCDCETGIMPSWVNEVQSQLEKMGVTSPPRGICAETTAAGCECSTSLYGNVHTDPSLLDGKSITATKTNSTTDLKTCSSSRPLNTSACMVAVNCEKESGSSLVESAGSTSPSTQNTSTSPNKAIRCMGVAVPATYASLLREKSCESCGSPIKGEGHATVKPVDLMRWLVRLVTPKGGLVLDPFTGSGTTGVAAVLEGARFVGVELSPDYQKIAVARIAGAEASKAGEQIGLFDEE